MNESTELKTGMTTTYEVGGKTITLKPVTLGKMKKAVAALTGEGETFDLIERYLVEALDNGTNDFATVEWIRDNITLPIANQIITDMRTINGMTDFLPSRGPAARTETKDLLEKEAPRIPSV